MPLQMAQRFAPIFTRYPDVVARLPKNVAPSNVLLTPDVRRSLPPNFLGQLQAALAHSLMWVYLLTLALALIGLAAMFLLPGGRAEKYAYHAVAEAEEEAEAARVETEMSTFG